MEDKVKEVLNREISRREFIRKGIIGAGGIVVGTYALRNLFKVKNLGVGFSKDAPKELWKWSKEAYDYEKLRDAVQCKLCPHGCILEKNDRGFCRTRANKEGKLYSIAYGNPCSVHLDPIEKKPLFHFLPATAAFSIATAGCNFRCLGCFNWSLSQFKPEELQN